MTRDLSVLLVNGIAGIELKFQEGLFLQAMKRGDVVLLDEINLANEDALALLYQLLTLGYIEFQGEKVFPGEGFQLIVSQNPSNYAGRNRMSEAFMNRFEIQYVREMEPKEMAEIIVNKYGLAKLGVSLDDFHKLAEMQKELDVMSRSGKFDYFNTDGSYRFALRNLERIAEDLIKRREAGDRKNPRDILMEESFMEYGTLLDQDDKNIKELEKLFKERLGWERPKEGAYKFENVKGDTALKLKGVEVLKKPHETETLASRVEPLTELASMGNVRAQILKGFRDGGLETVTDGEGNFQKVHRSRPVLFVGQSGGGKTEMVADTARELHWKYISVSLGAATVETLIGSYLLDEETGTFRYQEGILVKAMREGYAIVLEEINMADAAVIEVLNEYFDRGTFTIPGLARQVPIHPDFRLFATMNPIEGKTGRNIGRVGLSPALRSRFREVWVRSERTKGEQYRIMLGGIKKLVSALMTHGTRNTEEIQTGLGDDYIDELRNRRTGESFSQAVKAVKAIQPVTATGVSSASVTSATVVRMAQNQKKEEAKTIDPKELEEKKRRYEETFIQVSQGAVSVRESPPDEKGETHWAYAPSTNTLFYPADQMAETDLDEIIGVGVHESMHRYGTRYTSIFEEFLNEKKLAGMVFNILEDGRIENWGRLRFKGAARYLRTLNDRKIFKKPVGEMFAWEREIKEGPRAGEKVPTSNSSQLHNFFLYLAKRGSDPDAAEKIKEILDIIGGQNQELREDLEGLMAKGVFGGARDEDMLKHGMRGIFSLVPLRLAGSRVDFERNPTEEYIRELALAQGEIIREEVMPLVYKWAVNDVQKGEAGEGGGGEGKGGKPGEGKPGKAEIKPGKPGQGGKPISPKEWKKIWDSLDPDQKKELEKALQDQLGDKAADRTKGDSKDFKDAQQDASLSAPMSERDRLLKQVGKMISELTGYLREVIQNAVRPKEITGLKKGRLDVRRLMNSIARGFTDMRFYKKRVIPSKKNLKFTIIIDESGSMADKQRMASAVGYNAIKGAFVMMETLENLGIDFNVRWFGDKTGLHKRFKNQNEPQDVPRGYSTRSDKNKVIEDIYDSIGQKGGNNEVAALNATIQDIEKHGDEVHFVAVFTDGMGLVEGIQEILKKVRDKKGQVGRSKVEFMGVGLGNQTETVPDVYGEEYSIFLKDEDIHQLPLRIKQVMERIIRGVYLGEKGKKASSRLSGSQRSRDGMIGQGKKAIAEFQKKLESGAYEVRRDEKIEAEYEDMLAGHKVYVMDAIVQGQDDFVMGYRDKKNQRIYIAKEVLRQLKNNKNLLREYLFHESHCDEDVEGSHYLTIALQQKLFPENYSAENYFQDSRGVWMQYSKFGWLNRFLMKTAQYFPRLVDFFFRPFIAKGDLGTELRRSIQDILDRKILGKRGYQYRSIEEAWNTYLDEEFASDKFYKPNRAFIENHFEGLRKVFRDSEKWIRRFGVRDFLDIYMRLVMSDKKSAGTLNLLNKDNELASQFFENTLPELEKVFGADFNRYWPDLVSILEQSSGMTCVLSGENLGKIQKTIGRKKFEKYLPGLIKIALKAENERMSILTDGFPEVYAAFGDNLGKYWDDIIEMCSKSKNLTNRFFKQGLPSIYAALGADFDKFWPDLVAHIKRMEGREKNPISGFRKRLPWLIKFLRGKGKLDQYWKDAIKVNEAFNEHDTDAVMDAFGNIFQATGDDWEFYWPGIVELMEAQGSMGTAMLNTGFKKMKDLYGDDLKNFWPGLVNLLKILNHDLHSFLDVFLPWAASLYENRMEDAIALLNKLLVEATHEQRTRIGNVLEDIGRFESQRFTAEVFDVGKIVDLKGKKEDVRRRLEAIANMSSDAEQIIEELDAWRSTFTAQKSAESEDEGFELKTQMARAFGYVSQGTAAKEQFQRNLAEGEYSGSRNVSLEQAFSDVLNGHEVYVVDGIFINESDFWMGSRDIENGRIYIAREVFQKLQGKSGILREFLWHESNEDPALGDDHYQLIARQQKLFPFNYQGRGYFKGKDGALYQYSSSRWKNYFWKLLASFVPASLLRRPVIAKGDLGVVLRDRIDAFIARQKSRQEGYLYDSRDEALEKYEAMFGKSNPSEIKLIMKSLPNAEDWIKRYGFKPFADLIRLDKDDAKRVLRKDLPYLKKVLGDDFEICLMDLPEIGAKSKYVLPSLIQGGIPTAKKVLGDRFADYWPGLKQIILAQREYSNYWLKKELPKLHEAFGKEFDFYWQGIAKIESYAVENSSDRRITLSQSVLMLQVIFEDRLKVVWPQIVEIAFISGPLANSLFVEGLLNVKKALGEDFMTSWQDLARIAINLKTSANMIFNSLAKVIRKLKKEGKFAKYWPDFIHVMMKHGRSSALFFDVWKGLRNTMGEDWEVFWPDVLDVVLSSSSEDTLLVLRWLLHGDSDTVFNVPIKDLFPTLLELSKLADGNASILIQNLMSRLSHLYSQADSDINRASVMLKKMLIGLTSADEKRAVIRKFESLLTALSDSRGTWKMPPRSILDRVESIIDLSADGSQILQEMDEWEQSLLNPESSQTSDPFSLTGVVSSVMGYVAQGTAAKEQFRQNLAGGEYSRSRNLGLEEEFSGVLNGHEVYVVDGIFINESDFWMGSRDIENGRIYIAKEALAELRRGPPGVLQEFLWHESHEDPFNGRDHYQLIVEQQNLFKENYTDSSYGRDQNGVLYQLPVLNASWRKVLSLAPSLVWWLQRKEVRIAKGVLGQSLRAIIDGELSKQRRGIRYETVEEAYDAYKAVHDTVNEKAWNIISKYSKENEDVILRFGLDALFDVATMAFDVEEWFGKNMPLAVNALARDDYFSDWLFSEGISRIKHAFHSNADIELFCHVLLKLKSWEIATIKVNDSGVGEWFEKIDLVNQALDIFKLRIDTFFHQVMKLYDEFGRSTGALVSCIILEGGKYFGDKLPDVWLDLVALYRKDPRDTPYVLLSSLPRLGEMFGDKLIDYWPDLFGLVKDDPASPEALFESEMYHTYNVLGEHFIKFWPDILKLAKISNPNMHTFFYEALPALALVYGDDLPKYWSQFVEAGLKAGEHVTLLFEHGFVHFKALITEPSSVEPLADELLKIVADVGSPSDKLFQLVLPGLADLFDKNEEDEKRMLDFIKKLISVVKNNEERQKVFESLERLEILFQSFEIAKDGIMDREDIKNRLIGIVNLNVKDSDINSEIVELINQMQDEAVASAEEPGDAFSFAANSGFIAQGAEAKNEFNQNLLSGLYDALRDQKLEEEFKYILAGHEVYVIPAIVKGENDFILGYRDAENRKIYLSQEMAAKLRSSGLSLLKEYIWHEVNEDPAGGSDHYALIARQQVVFPENYAYKGYFKNKDGVLYQYTASRWRNYFWRLLANFVPVSWIRQPVIAKGILGDELREFIHKKVLEDKGYTYDSEKEAIQLSNGAYGHPEFIKKMREYLVDHEDWVKRFGFVPLVYYYVNQRSGEGQSSGYWLSDYFTRLTRNRVEIGEEIFSKYGKELLGVSRAAPIHFPLFLKELSAFKAKFESRWKSLLPAVFEETIKTGEWSHHILGGVNTFEKIIQNEQELRMVWGQLLELGKAAGDEIFEKLDMLMKQFGSHFMEYWPDIVELGKQAKVTANEVLYRALPAMLVLFKDHPDKYNTALGVLLKLSSMRTEKTSEMLDKLFNELFQIYKADKFTPESARDETIRTDILRIANLTVDDVQAGEELAQLIKVIRGEVSPKAAGPEAEETFEFAEAGGYIAQGEESKREFEENLNAGLYETSRDVGFEKEYKNLLKGHQVYVIPAIVKGENDFLLGYRDIQNHHVYLSEEVMEILRMGPESLLREYIWHEVHENPATGDDHYALIVKQQKNRSFRRNYEGKGYTPAKMKINGRNVNVLLNDKGQIAKGELGGYLRRTIDGLKKIRGPFNSVEDALEAYRNLYGRENDAWLDGLLKEMKESLHEYEWWIKNFGIRDFMVLYRRQGVSLSPLLFDDGFNMIKDIFGDKIQQGYWPVIAMLGRMADEDVATLFTNGFPAVIGLVRDIDSFKRVGAKLLKLIEAGKGNATHVLYALHELKSLVRDEETLDRLVVLLSNLAEAVREDRAPDFFEAGMEGALSLFDENSDALSKFIVLFEKLILAHPDHSSEIVTALVNLFIWIRRDASRSEPQKGDILKRLQEIADLSVNGEQVTAELERLLENVSASQREDVDTDETFGFASGSFSTSNELNVSGLRGITNEEVGDAVSKTLDASGIRAETQTQSGGRTLSFMASAIEGISSSLPNEKEFGTLLKTFVDSESFRNLDADIKNEFLAARLVVIGDQSYVARNPKGTSYAHFGLSGENNIATMYIGRNLLEGLAKEFPEELAALIKIEMNRKIYRKNHEMDQRTSRQVVKDSGIDAETLNRIKKAIARIEAYEWVGARKAAEFAEGIARAAEHISQTGENVSVMDGVILGELNGYLLNEVVEILSSKIDEDSTKEKLKKSAAAVEDYRQVKGLGQLIQNLQAALNEQSEAIEINPLMGEVRMFRKDGRESEDVEIGNDASQLISRLMGKRSGNVERIFIDLKRGPVNLESVLREMLNDRALTKGEIAQSGSMVYEYMDIRGAELIHISAGSESVNQIKSAAQVYERFRTLTSQDLKNHVPVGIEIDLIQQMNDQEREAFLEKYHDVLAIIGPAGDIEKLLEGFKYRANIIANLQKYENLDEEHKMLVLEQDSKLKISGASVLRITKDSLGQSTEHIVNLARYIAEIGKSKAKSDPKLNQLLTEVLKTMYEKGEIPEELLAEMPLAKILDNPEGFVFPPVKTQTLSDINSYLRAQKYVETMA